MQNRNISPLQRTEIITILCSSFLLVNCLAGFVILMIDPDMCERFLLWEALILIIAVVSVECARRVIGKIASNRGYSAH